MYPVCTASPPNNSMQRTARQESEQVHRRVSSLLLEQGGCRDAEIGRRPLGKTLVPLTAIHLALKSGSCNVAERPVMPLRIAPKARVERLGQILDLEI